MPASLLNLSANERADLSDLQFLAQSQPLGMQADILGTFASDAQNTAAMSVLHGFGCRAGVAVTSQSPAQNQVSVAPGAAILGWRRDTEQPTFGVLAAMDGIAAQPQGIDFSGYPSGTYKVWLRLSYTPAASQNRTFWNAASPGFDYAQLTETRLAATWEVQALAQSGTPGAEWLAIAKVTWAAPTQPGGPGTLSALVDLRPLYFDGRPDAATPYSSTWGTGTDRSPDRGTYGVGNLRRFVDATTTCIEDIKGPGLRRWWDAGIGGINVGFTPNTPVEARVAIGDANFYLQGRSASSTSARLVGYVPPSGGSTFDGLRFLSDRSQWMCRSSTLPIVTVSQYGTVGVGTLADVDIFYGPGRALMECVASVQGQAGLRVGARAPNGAVPVGVDSLLHIVAPDQSGNLAQVYFGRGGVQGTEQMLYKLGKGSSGNFHIYDNVNQSLFFDYAFADRSLRLSAVDFYVYDTGSSQPWLTYFSSTKVATFGGAVSADTVRASTLTSPAGITVVGSATVSNTLTAQNVLQANQSVNVGSKVLLLSDRIRLPVFNTQNRTVRPANAVVGDMFFDPSQYAPQGCIVILGPQGWCAIELTSGG